MDATRIFLFFLGLAYPRVLWAHPAFSEDFSLKLHSYASSPKERELIARILRLEILPAQARSLILQVPFLKDEEKQELLKLIDEHEKSQRYPRIPSEETVSDLPQTDSKRDSIVRYLLSRIENETEYAWVQKLRVSSLGSEEIATWLKQSPAFLKPEEVAMVQSLARSTEADFETAPEAESSSYSQEWMVGYNYVSGTSGYQLGRRESAFSVRHELRASGLLDDRAYRAEVGLKAGNSLFAPDENLQLENLILEFRGRRADLVAGTHTLALPSQVFGQDWIGAEYILHEGDRTDPIGIYAGSTWQRTSDPGRTHHEGAVLGGIYKLREENWGLWHLNFLAARRDSEQSETYTASFGMTRQIDPANWLEALVVSSHGEIGGSGRDTGSLAQLRGSLSEGIFYADAEILRVAETYRNLAAPDFGAGTEIYMRAGVKKPWYGLEMENFQEESLELSQDVHTKSPGMRIWFPGFLGRETGWLGWHYSEVNSFQEGSAFHEDSRIHAVNYAETTGRMDWDSEFRFRQTDDYSPLGYQKDEGYSLTASARFLRFNPIGLAPEVSLRMDKLDVGGIGVEDSGTASFGLSGPTHSGLWLSGWFHWQNRESPVLDRNYEQVGLDMSLEAPLVEDWRQSLKLEVQWEEALYEGGQGNPRENSVRLSAIQKF